MPTAGGYQLRVFGAYSRHVREGMVRIDAETADGDLLATAFADDKGGQTVVLLNRGLAPRMVQVKNTRHGFSAVERTDPYRENAGESSKLESGDKLAIEPGAVVTLSNVPLGRPSREP